MTATAKRAVGVVLRAFAVAATTVAFSVLSSAAAGAAGTGYGGGTPPPSPPTATSFCDTGTVITSSTVLSTGGTVTGTVGASTVSVNVPSGDFSGGVQVSITDTSTTATAPAGDTIVLAFGVNFCINGNKVTGAFAAPVTVTVTDPAIAPGEKLFLQTASGLVPITPASIGTGSFTVTITSDPDFVLVAAAVATPIPGATSVVTGKPFLLEGLIAGGLVLLGCGLLLRLRLRHR
jgi:hypothetical protein